MLNGQPMGHRFDQVLSIATGITQHNHNLNKMIPIL